MSTGRLPLIVGCDASSKRLAFFVIQGVTNTTRTEVLLLAPKLSDKFHPANLYAARVSVRTFLNELKPISAGTDKWLVIEYPVVGRGGSRATIVQSLVQGVVQECFYEAGYNIQTVYPGTWKSWLGVNTRSKRSSSNHGRGGKPAIRQAMKAKYPKDAQACGGDDDLYDAAAIARWGLASHGAGRLVG